MPKYKSSLFGSMFATDVSNLSRLEDRIRLLKEDLESECQLRNRIERERADLTVHLCAMNDQAEDTDDTTACHIEYNHEREAELQNLRRLLEESQLESEDAINLLRKKHQDCLLEYQELHKSLHKKYSNTYYFYLL